MSKNRKNNHLMMMYYNASLNSNKRILDIFSTTQVATNVQIPLILNIPVGKTVYIDWGDGSSLVECAGAVADVTYTSNYTTAGEFNVKLSWDYSSIPTFKIAQTTATITFPKGIKNLKNLKSLDTLSLFNASKLTTVCNISDFPMVTYYFFLYSLPNLTVTGNISDFPRVTSSFNLNSLPNLTVTGNISDFPRVTSSFILNILPNLAATGNIIDFPRVTSSFILNILPNLAATGNIIDFPRVTGQFNLNNLSNLTATGNIIDFPRATTNFNLYNLPNFTATGNISTLPPLTANNSTLAITNCPNVNLTIDTPPVWKYTTITLHAGLTTTQVNDFVKLWAQVTEAGGVKNVNIAGNNEPLTESDPDVAAALQILSDKNKILAYNI